MDRLLWIAQVILAGIFLFTGFTKIFAYDKLVRAVETRLKNHPIRMTHGQAIVVGIFEIAGAVAVLIPADVWPPWVLLRLACAGLGLLMVIAGIYHLRRQESAAPTVALFLLTLFVIVGRWPK
jgi:uncharacterized membrane protein YphA (DoxX/SURF4 family)